MKTRLKRAEQVGRNRELLLAAARRVFLGRGYGAASLDSIAEAAGFSKGVIYSQFDSKADLFLALLEARIAERGDENDAIADSGRAGVAALIARAQADATREPGWAALLVEFRSHAARDAELSRRYAQLHDATVGRLAARLERMHRDAGLEPAVAPRIMAQLLLAVGSGAILERAVEPAALPDEPVAEALLRALGL
jgi:AcrR family transcriptional regulator